MTGSGSRRGVLVGLLGGVVFVVGSVLVGELFLPLWVLATCGVVTALFAVPLLLSARWAAPFDRVFARRVVVPRWLWLAVVATGVVSLRLSQDGLLTARSFALAALLGVSVSLVVSTLASLFTHTTGSITLPAWLAVVGIGGFATLGWVAASTHSVSATLFLLAFVTFFVYLWFVVPLAIYQRHTDGDDGGPLDTYPTISVVVPAYNEAGYVGRCIDHLLASDYPTDRFDVLVVDDGSTDGTLAEATERARRAGPTVTVHSKPNGGKHTALNYGVEQTTGDVVVVVDADSFVEPTALTTVARKFETDAGIGALASDVRVLNRQHGVSRLQTLEYALGISTIRRAFDYFGAIPVVPGCLGAFRREALLDAGGYDGDTLTEDFDLTVKVLKAGWTVRHTAATVWTEAPYSWRDLYRQRLRWNRGNIEVVWKHRDVFVGDEARYLHRLVFPFSLLTMLLAPVVGLTTAAVVVASALTGSVATVASVLVYFLVVGGVLATVAVRLEGESLRLLPYAVPLVVVYPLFQALAIGMSAHSVLSHRKRDWANVRRMAQDPTAERT